jgi:GTP-binding protein HflX
MQRAYLVSLQLPGQSDWEVEDSLDELWELAEDAGLEVVDRFVQKRAIPDPATFIGKGKAEELGAIVEPDELIIFDNELSPAQQGNLAEIIDAPVLDRTQLILDIFAQRAQSREGKIQVELAQLNYLLPRLTGAGKALSRLGGGIGTRGPGETKLETDRRRLRKRISDLRAELEEIRKVRATHRARRDQMAAPVVALVGYTNAGKSTLLRELSGTDTFVADQLFATLDPTIRRWELPDGRWVFLTDTVGFIRRLPHTLVAAFRATLEEILFADLILHVIDVSHPQAREQQEAVEQVLAEIGAAQPVINVYNKIDKIPAGIEAGGAGVPVSALTGENLDRLGAEVAAFFSSLFSVQKFHFSFANFGEASRLRELGRVLEERFTETGVEITAEVDQATAGLMRAFRVE